MLIFKEINYKGGEIYKNLASLWYDRGVECPQGNLLKKLPIFIVIDKFSEITLSLFYYQSEFSKKKKLFIQYPIAKTWKQH
jgi:hypothetical protein